MTKRHDDMFDAVLSGVAEKAPRTSQQRDASRSGARFLKRGNAISDKLSAEREEKTLQWIDPARCRMWDRHNRDYGLLSEENCRDLIDGIRAQGRQEFPAIVRRVEGDEYEYEVICGARRHFAVSWLRANTYTQFKYLVEVRDLTDEEAFRLSDIENRDREDISDFERARDYAEAVRLYYDGKQKAMAARLEVSEVWLSRYLDLARLPQEVVRAFPSIRDIRELHARTLKPLLKAPTTRAELLTAAADLGARQELARNGQGAFIDAPTVVATLKAASQPAKTKRKPSVEEFSAESGAVLVCSKQGRKLRLEFDQALSREDLESAFHAFLDARY